MVKYTNETIIYFPKLSSWKVLSDKMATLYKNLTKHADVTIFSLATVRFHVAPGPESVLSVRVTAIVVSQTVHHVSMHTTQTK